MLRLVRKFFADKAEKEDKEKKKKSLKYSKLEKAAIGTGLGGLLVATAGDILPKSEEDKKLLGKLKEEAAKRGIDVKEGSRSLYNPNKDYIVLSKRSGSSTLAHELGHRHFHKDSDAGKLGKLAHDNYAGIGSNFIQKQIDKTGSKKLDKFYETAREIMPWTSTIGLGVATGVNKANKEERGEKEGAINKHVATVAPILQYAPKLTAEAAASIHAHKLLKKAGASRKELAKADLSNLGAFGTYAGTAMTMGAIGKLSKDLGYKFRKRSIERKKKNKEEKHNDN